MGIPVGAVAQTHMSPSAALPRGVSRDVAGRWSSQDSNKHACGTPAWQVAASSATPPGSPLMPLSFLPQPPVLDLPPSISWHCDTLSSPLQFCCVGRQSLQQTLLPALPAARWPSWLPRLPTAAWVRESLASWPSGILCVSKRASQDELHPFLFLRKTGRTLSFTQ